MLENAFQFVSLTRYGSSVTTVPTGVFATAKFALLGLAVSYLVMAAMMWSTKRKAA